MGNDNNRIAHGAPSNVPNPAALNGSKRMQEISLLSDQLN
jgi:hypothetical protein